MNLRPTHRRVLWAGLIAALLGLLAGGTFVWWRAEAQAEVAATAVPPTPDLAGWPAELRHRIEACERRLRDGEQPVARLGELARLYHANGFFAEALRIYPALQALDPAEPRWAHRHATILAGYGEAEPAVALWEQVCALAPDARVPALRLADLRLKQNDLPAAERLYAQVLDRHPDDPYAQLGLARCDVEAERWTAARDRLERLVQQTQFQLGYDLIVTVYERLGQTERAEAIRGQAMASGAYRDPVDPWMEELYQDCYDVYQLSLAAGAAERSGDPATAVQRLERALRFAPGQASLHFQLGLLHVRQQEPAKGRSHLERCTQLDPGFPDAWSHLSALLLQSGDRAGAERAIAQGLVHAPDSYGLHLMQARRAAEAGRTAAAVRAYQTAIRLRPNTADPYIELALTYFKTNALAEGAEQMRAALVAEPEHPTALTALTMHAISTGDETGAREWLERARQQPRVPRQQWQDLRAAFVQQFGRAPD